MPKSNLLSYLNRVGALLFISLALFSCNQYEEEAVELSQSTPELMSTLKSDISDKSKLEVYHQLYKINKYSNPEAAYAFLEDELKLSEKTSNKLHLALSLHGLGYFHNANGEYEKAVNNYLNAFDLFNDLGDEARGADELLNIGFVFLRADDYKDALAYFKKASSVYEKNNDFEYLIKSQLNIATCLSSEQLHAFSEAESHFSKAISIQKSFNPSDYNRLAYITNELGRVIFLQEKYDEAINTYSEAIKFAEDNNVFKSNIYYNIAEAYLYNQQYDEALNWVELAEELPNASTNNKVVAIERANIAIEVHQALGNYNEAAKHITYIINKYNDNTISTAFSKTLDLAIDNHKALIASNRNLSYDKIFHVYDLKEHQEKLMEEFNKLDKEPLLIALTKEVKNHEIEVKQASLSNERWLIAKSVGTLVLILLAAFTMAYRAYIKNKTIREDFQHRMKVGMENLNKPTEELLKLITPTDDLLTMKTQIDELESYQQNKS